MQKDLYIKINLLHEHTFDSLRDKVPVVVCDHADTDQRGIRIIYGGSVFKFHLILIYRIKRNSITALVTNENIIQTFNGAAGKEYF